MANPQEETPSNHALRLAGALGVVFAMMLAAAPAWAQSAGLAEIDGAVFDTDRKPLAKATVIVQNIDTGYTRTIVTDANGNWTANAMPVGRYQLDVSYGSLVAVKMSGIVLTIGSSTTKDVTLATGFISEVIVVTGQQSLADLSGSATSNTIVQKQIENLPIRGRNFVEFVQLSPSVLQEPDRFGIVMSGQRGISANVSIDGTDDNDPMQGNQRGGNEAVFFFPQAAVKEFQVVRSGAGAEVGRTSAGFINVVTKSGTNRFMGEAFDYNRNSKLASEDAFGRHLDNAQNQYGGSFGGPLVHDKAFFFFGGEHNHLLVPFFVQFQPQASTPVPAALQAIQGPYAGTNDPTSIFGRLDIQVTAKQTLNMTYTYGRLDGTNFNFNSPRVDAAPSTNYLRTTKSGAGVLSLLSVFGNDKANDMHFQVATDNRTEDPNTHSPLISIAGFGTLGGDASRPRLFNSTRYQTSDTLNFGNTRNQMKVGYDFNVTSGVHQRESNINGRYDFRSLADYVAGRISRYRQTLSGGDPEDLIYRGTQKEAALFIEDRIDLRNVTLTAGFRWEGQWNPSPTHPRADLPETVGTRNDLKMYQPRLGLAWNIAGRGTTVLRTAAGIYAPRTAANIFGHAFTDNAVTLTSVDSRTDPALLNFLNFPNALTSLPPGAKLDPQRVFGFSADFQNARATNASLTFEQALGPGARISVGYVHVRTTHLARRWDHNLFAPTIDATGMPIYPRTRPNTTIGWFSVNESDGLQIYKAVPVTLDISRGRIHFQLNYTWADNKDTDSNEASLIGETVLNTFDTNAEWAPSKYDVRHAVNASLVYDLPFGFTVGGIVLARTGYPYTPIIGFDTQNDGNDGNDRAIINGHVAGRNSLRQPSFMDIDLRLAKKITISRANFELIAEWFNVTNASNLNFGVDQISAYGNTASPVATAGRPLFAPSTARYGGPRQLQLGAKMWF